MAKFGAVAVAGLLMAVGCGDEDEGGSVSGSNEALCERICARTDGPRCGDQSRDDCEDTCLEQVETTPAQCDGELNAFLRCATKAKFTCDAAGDADAVACRDQLDDLTQCFIRYEPDEPETDAGSRPQPDSGTPSRPDAGSTNDDAICAPSANDDACDRCTGSSCCDEMVACSEDTACTALSSCLNRCDADDDACQQSCFTAASPAAIATFSQMLSCFAQQCGSVCGSELGSDAGTPDSGSDDNNGEPADCLPSGVPDGYCTDPKRPFGHECSAAPFADCVELENVSDVYCCGQ